jgi:hypothetical protein
MYELFGWPGFVAAYNAGPERYRQYLVDGRPLPRETRIYTAKLLPLIGLAAVDGTTTEVAPPLDRREAPLFVGRSRRNPTANPAQKNPGSFATSATRQRLMHFQMRRTPMTSSAFKTAMSRRDDDSRTISHFWMRQRGLARAVGNDGQHWKTMAG